MTNSNNPDQDELAFADFLRQSIPPEKPTAATPARATPHNAPVVIQVRITPSEAIQAGFMATIGCLLAWFVVLVLGVLIFVIVTGGSIAALLRSAR